MFLEKILRLIAGLFVGAYVARYLGPTQYGVLNYSISLIALFGSVATLGLESIVVRELVTNPEKRNSILGTALLLRLIAAVTVCVLVVAFVLTTHHQQPLQLVLLVMCATILFETFQVIDYFFQAQVLSRYAVYSQMVALVCVSVFRVVLVSQDAPLQLFAFSYVLDPLIIGLGFLFFGVQKLKIRFAALRWSTSDARMLLRYSWPLIFTSLAITIYMRIDQIMIKWLMNDTANGIYGVAVRLAEMWNFIPVAISASVFPAILNARQSNNELYEKRLQQLYDLVVGVSLIVAVVMTFASPLVVNILFGEQYKEASTILAIYIWSGVFVFLGVANGKWIVAENLQVFKMYVIVISCLINIGLNFLLIPIYGLVGAAVSTLLSYAFAAYFGFAFSRKTFPTFVASSKALNPIRLLGYLVKLLQKK
jgi:O-antigen/teichoic acid export membrane protein